MFSAIVLQVTSGCVEVRLLWKCGCCGSEAINLMHSGTAVVVGEEEEVSRVNSDATSVVSTVRVLDTRRIATPHFPRERGGRG